MPHPIRRPGPIRLDELAALTGREPAELTRVFPEPAARQRAPGRTRATAAKKSENDERIDTVLRAEPTTRTIEIWQSLHSEHDVTACYEAIRAYGSTHRAEHRQT